MFKTLTFDPKALLGTTRRRGEAAEICRPAPHRCRQHTAAVFGVLALSVGLASVADGQLQVPLPRAVGLQIDSVQVVGRDLSIAQPIDIALGVDGSVFLVDLGNTSILKLSATGQLVWRFGASGQGPGEFRMPYRVCALPNGGVLVWDEGTQQVTRIDSVGRYKGRTFLDIEFASIDNIVSLRGGGVAITGVARSPSAYASAIHLFDDSLKYQRSFGPLPVAKVRYALDSWGAGMTSRLPGGNLLFVRRLPYEILEFTPAGQLASRPIAAPLGRGSTVDDGISIKQENGKMVRRAVPTLAPGAAHRLPNGSVWGSHSIGRERFWDIFDPRGILVASEPVPSGVTYLVGFDEARGNLWFRGNVDDEPVLLRARTRLINDGRRR